MQKHLALLGSGSYGEFAKKVVTDLGVSFSVLSGRDAFEGVKNSFFDFSTHPATHVYVATPNYTHYVLVKAALEAKKHVLCEKPLALTSKEVEELYDLAKNQDGYLGVGFVLPNHRYYQAIKEAQNEHGPIQAIKVINNATEGTLEPEWYWDKKLSGGWFMVAEIHWFHLLAWLTGTKGITIDSASEEVEHNRTVATHVKAKTAEACTLTVDHRLDSSYKNFECTVKISFEGGAITIDDWVPHSLKNDFSLHRLDSAIETRPRDAIYQELIKTNIEQLLNNEPSDSQAVIVAHQAALKAQEVSDRIVRR